MDTQTIAIDEIKINTTKRHRKDMGDLEALADSISKQGLLQPIGITENNELVFGERRLRAARDILGWTEIDARVVNVTSLLDGEHDENEVRKNFTESERYTILQSIKARLEFLGDRRGRPSVGHGPQLDDEIEEWTPGSGNGLLIPGRGPELKIERGEETRDIAARAAGFGSDREARRVAKIVELGTPELIEAMDRKVVSVRSAADLACLPKDEQRKILAGGSKEIAKKAVEIRGEIVGHGPQLDSDEYYTPGYLIEAATEVLDRIDLDPCSSEVANRTVQALRYFDKSADGLVRGWEGAETLWINWPYSDPLPWCTKIVEWCDARMGNIGIALGKHDSSTAWFAKMSEVTQLYCLLGERVHHVLPNGDPANKTNFCSTVFLFSCGEISEKTRSKFIASFGSYGQIVEAI